MPDLLTLAKGLASGLPIAALVTTEAVSSRLSLGDLGSTFGGGPVPCAAALATIDVIEREGLIANAVRVGNHLMREAADHSGRRVGAGPGPPDRVPTRRARQPMSRRRSSPGASWPGRREIPPYSG